MEEKLDYTVTLEETLKGKPTACLCGALRVISRNSCMPDITRKEITDKILERFMPNPLHWLRIDIEYMDDDVADVLHDMIFKGPQRMSASDGKTACRVMASLRGLYWVDRRDWKDGKKAVSCTFAVPEEIRALFEDEDAFWESRAIGTSIVYYAYSAITLYGVVSYKELQGLIDRYYHDVDAEPLREGEHYFNTDFIWAILQGRSTSTDCEYILRNNWICHKEFAGEKKELDELIALFIKVRDHHERWYPANDREFLFFNDDFFFLNMPEYDKLEKFLNAHGMPDQEACEWMFHDIVGRLQVGVKRPGILMQDVSQKLKMAGDTDVAAFSALWTAFVNRVRRRSLNGWTPEEAYAHLQQTTGSRPQALKVNPCAAVGRNDPCPCGSGKKFKACCGMKRKKTEAINKLAQERLDVYLAMRKKTNSFVSRYAVPMIGLKERQAAAERIGIIKDGVPSSEVNTQVNGPVVGDYATMMDDQFGPPPIKRLIASAAKFKGDDAEALEMCKQYRYTWLEILDVEPGVGVVCKDLLTGETGFLMETSFSQDFNVCGITVCAGVGRLPNGTWMILGVMHPSDFENPSIVLKIILTHLSLPTELPIMLSFADQARFAAETIKRINANGRFGSIQYGCLP